MQHPETQDSYLTAVLRDIPTDVPMTAAALKADDYDNDDVNCNRSYHPSINIDAISTINPAFPQEWDAFYTDFFHFANVTGAATPSTNKNIIAYKPAGSSVADDPAHIPELQELYTLQMN